VEDVDTVVTVLENNKESKKIQKHLLRIKEDLSDLSRILAEDGLDPDGYSWQDALTIVLGVAEEERQI